MNHVLGMYLYGLERIFEQGYAFSCRYKSAGNFYRGLRTGTMRCPPSIGPFKPSAPFFLFFFWHWNCFIILLILCIILTTKTAWRSGGHSVCISFRTWVRIPGPPLSQYYYFSGIPVHILFCNPPYTLTHPSPRWPMARSGGQ